MEEKDIHIIITNYLSNEATPDEIVALKVWLKETPENELLFQEYKDAWSIIESRNTAFIPDKERVWLKILSKIQSLNPVKSYSRSFVLRVASMAAVFALLIGVAFTFYFMQNQLLPVNEVVVKAPSGQKAEVLLPDGSTVWLNSETILAYDSDFNRNNRKIRLNGEAFFDVASSENATFEVIANQFQIQVHGTAFDVKAYEEDENVSVSLVRGHLTVHDAANHQLLADLTPNQKALLFKDTRTAKVENVNTELDGIWRYGRLRISDEPIHSVIEKMSRWYGVDITVKGKMKDEHYWFTIKTESLTEMLRLINKITPINYSINGEEVTIEYK